MLLLLVLYKPLQLPCNVCYCFCPAAKFCVLAVESLSEIHVLVGQSSSNAYNQQYQEALIAIVQT